MTKHKETKTDRQDEWCMPDEYIFYHNLKSRGKNNIQRRRFHSGHYIFSRGRLTNTELEAKTNPSMAKRADIQIEIVSDKKTKTKTLSLIKAHNSKHIEQVSHNEARSQYLQAFFFVHTKWLYWSSRVFFFHRNNHPPTHGWKYYRRERKREDKSLWRQKNHNIQYVVWQQQWK